MKSEPTSPVVRPDVDMMSEGPSRVGIRDRLIALTAVPNKKAAAAVAAYAAKLAHGKGNYAIIDYNLSTTSGRARRDGFGAGMENYPGMKFAGMQISHSIPQTALREAVDFVLQQGYIITNLFGGITLCAMLVILEMAWAVMGFRMISQMRYHHRAAAYFIFGPLVYAIEAAIGISMMLGLLSRLGALLGVAMGLNLWLGLYSAPHEWPWTYFFPIIIMGLFWLNPPGPVLGLDALNVKAARYLRPQRIYLA